MGATLLYNLPTSTVDLEFWTREGSNTGTPLALAPGDTVQITSDRSVSGVFKKYTAADIHNKTASNDGVFKCDSGTWEVGGKTGTCDGIFRQVRKDDHFAIHGTNVVMDFDAIIYSFSGDVSGIFDSPNWPGVFGQQNIELLSGTITVVDDTDNATSIFTDNTGTNCISEPSILALLVGGIAVYGWASRSTETRKTH